MYGLEMNNLLKVCIDEYLLTNIPIEIKGNFDTLPEFLKNKEVKKVDSYSYDSLKIRADDWAILPYETSTSKYIVGWIKENNVVANNVQIGIAVWFKTPQLSKYNYSNQNFNYLLSEQLQLDPMIYSEE